MFRPADRACRVARPDGVGEEKREPLFRRRGLRLRDDQQPADQPRNVDVERIALHGYENIAPRLLAAKEPVANICVFRRPSLIAALAKRAIQAAEQ